MKQKPSRQINAGSMADIAFLLLIFFLVTTTMSTNTGLQRRLPPFKPDSTIVPKPERDVMVVLINRENNIAVGGEAVDLEDICKRTKEFFLNTNEDENLPDKKQKEILFLGEFPVSKGVVSLQTDRTTNYSKYIEVQNELVRAVNELRNELALQRFKIPFKDLSEEKQKAIAEAFPLAISEAEPRMMTNLNQ